VVGSLSKSDKHFQLIFGIFYNLAYRCKKIFKYTCRCLGVSRWLRSSCFYSRGIASRDERTVKFFSPSPVLIRWNWIRSSPDPQSWIRSSPDPQKHKNVFLLCLRRQRNYWSYFAFSQIRLVEGKMFPAVLLPHERK